MRTTRTLGIALIALFGSGVVGCIEFVDEPLYPKDAKKDERRDDDDDDRPDSKKDRPDKKPEPKPKKTAKRKSKPKSKPKPKPVTPRDRFVAAWTDPHSAIKCGKGPLVLDRRLMVSVKPYKAGSVFGDTSSPETASAVRPVSPTVSFEMCGRLRSDDKLAFLWSTESGEPVGTGVCGPKKSIPGGYDDPRRNPAMISCALPDVPLMEAGVYKVEIYLSSTKLRELPVLLEEVLADDATTTLRVVDEARMIEAWLGKISGGKRSVLEVRMPFATSDEISYTWHYDGEPLGDPSRVDLTKVKGDVLPLFGPPFDDLTAYGGVYSVTVTHNGRKALTATFTVDDDGVRLLPEQRPDTPNRIVDRFVLVKVEVHPEAE